MKQSRISLGTRLILTLFTLSFIISTGCSKKDSTSENSASQIPEVITSSTSNITLTSATSGGICSDKGVPVTSRGVCYSTTPNPNIDSPKTVDGSGAGSFTSILENLQWNTTYFVRAYAINNSGVGYGNQLTFSTLSFGVITLQATNITLTTAICGGDILGDGGGEIRRKAIHWDTIPNLNYPFKNTEAKDEGGEGVFTFTLSNLSPNTRYYLKAQVEIYLNGRFESAYGDTTSFKTLGTSSLPTVSTSPISNLTQTGAVSGGNVTDDGGTAVSARGVCWSTNPTPTIVNSHTTDGNGLGSYTSTITGLNNNTTYYVRAYATNNTGTNYGDEVHFSTTSAFSIGQHYGGGVIFYVDPTGQHGLVSATIDQSAGAPWGCFGTSIGTQSGVGTGQANTTAIINNCSQTGTAARICNDLVLNGYDDWFLPSLFELDAMYANQSAIGGFNNYDAGYWSSTEVDAYDAWFHIFRDGGSGGNTNTKTVNYRVRAIRSF